MRRFFAGSFDDAQLAGMVSQITDRVGGGVVSDRVGYKIQTAIDHFRGEVGERPRQGLGDGVGQVDQHGIQQPGRPQLHFDGVFGATVEISQSQQPLDDREGVFHPPALGVQRHRLDSGQPGQFQGVGQIAVDRAVRLDLNQADLLARRALADPDDPVPNRRGMHQDLHHLILQVLSYALTGS